MLLKLQNPKILADVVSIISELVTEVKIKVSKEGVSIVAIDPANVALVAFVLPYTSFAEFKSEKDEVLGVSLDSLKSVLKRCSLGSSLILQSEEGILKIEIIDKIKRNFSLALINIDSEEKAMPSLDFSCIVEMSSKDFSEAIEDCSIVSDACSFSVFENKFIIEAKGLNSAKSEFSGDEVTLSGTEGKSRYSLEYLQKFSKAGKLSEKARINFSKDYPLKLEFRDSNFELAFVLAPRIESDE